MFFVVLAFKVPVYIATIVAGMYFGFLERTLKKDWAQAELTLIHKLVDSGVPDGLESELALRTLREQFLPRLRAAVGLKFLFILLLILEAIDLNR